MKKFLKVAGIALLVVAIATLLTGWLVSEPVPEGKTGPEAERLADKMLAAVNYNRYTEIRILKWTYGAGHQYVWYKQENIVNVRWKGYEVSFSPDTFEGSASLDGRGLEGEQKRDAITTAWTYFANDSFWLVAPFKVRDPGTERRLVETPEGPALLVTYRSGGVTPGDSYLWLLDGNGRPRAWKLWVKIIPIGGVTITWEDWKNYGGTWLCRLHNTGAFPLQVSGIEVEY